MDDQEQEVINAAMDWRDLYLASHQSETDDPALNLERIRAETRLCRLLGQVYFIADEDGGQR